MFETIVRLTDEQEALLRSWDPIDTLPEEMADLYDDIRSQMRAALFLYDRLVAEAKAASDD